jgi:hypothetical protein
LATEYGSKGLAIGSGQTMVQKWPNDGSSHNPTNGIRASQPTLGEQKAQAGATIKTNATSAVKSSQSADHPWGRKRAL